MEWNETENLILQLVFNVTIETLTHTHTFTLTHRVECTQTTHYTYTNKRAFTHISIAHKHTPTEAHMDVFTPALVVEIHCFNFELASWFVASNRMRSGMKWNCCWNVKCGNESWGVANVKYRHSTINQHIYFVIAWIGKKYCWLSLRLYVFFIDSRT